MAITAIDWIHAFCKEIGIPAPADQEVDEILRLAAVAAHASERKAAPVACWVGGLSGRPVGELREAAEALASDD